MPVELTIMDQRMLQLPGILKKKNLLTSMQSFYQVIGMERQNFITIKNKRSHHFKAANMEAVCRVYGIDAGWLFGQRDEPFLPQTNLKQKDTHILLKQRL